MLLEKWNIGEKELACQMACPCGDLGVCLAKEMQQSNCNILKFCLASFPEKPSKLLELGHGNAAHLDQLYDKNPNLLYFGLEVSETMFFEAAKTNTRWIDKNQAAFAVYDGEHIPFYEKTFDTVFSLNTIYFWKNPVRLLKEIYRVMEDDGTFVLSFCSPECMRKMPYACYGFKLYDIEEWGVFFENEGFYIDETAYLTEPFKINNKYFSSREFVRLLLRKI